MGTSGLEGGSGKRTGGNADTAPDSTLPGRRLVGVPELPLDQRQRNPSCKSSTAWGMPELGEARSVV